MRNVRLILLLCPLIVTALALAACTSRSAHDAADSHNSQPAQASQVSPWQMTLTTEPAQPINGKDTIFDVNVLTEAGQPLSDAELSAALVMPSMDMGKNEFRLQEHGEGAYRGSGRFTMAGPWNVVVTVTKNGQTGRQSFPIVVKR